MEIDTTSIIVTIIIVTIINSARARALSLTVSLSLSTTLAAGVSGNCRVDGLDALFVEEELYLCAAVVSELPLHGLADKDLIALAHLEDLAGTGESLDDSAHGVTVGLKGLLSQVAGGALALGEGPEIEKDHIIRVSLLLHLADLRDVKRVIEGSRGCNWEKGLSAREYGELAELGWRAAEKVLTP